VSRGGGGGFDSINVGWTGWLMTLASPASVTRIGDVERRGSVDPSSRRRSVGVADGRDGDTERGEQTVR